MRYLRAICLICLGGFLETFVGGRGREVWLSAFAVSGCGWAWYAIGVTISRALARLRASITGRPRVLPETDPQALAAEIRMLNAQLSQLRDTATSFDVSFDETLHRLNERLSRLEQQSAYVRSGRGA